MRFQVLGPVVAHGEHGPVPLGPARQRTVLAVLLADVSRGVVLDQLVERVWGAAPPQRARETLHTYLSRLRTLLSQAGGPALVRRAHSYLLDADPSTVDLHRFRRLSQQARQADDAQAAVLWRDALALWQGAPFADLDNDWLRAVAGSLEAERLAAILDRNDVLLRCGEHARLLPELSATATEQPLDERLAGQLMLALYRCGRQADALTHYQRLHDRLVEELGSDPGPALRALHQQLLRQEPELAPSPEPVIRPEPAAGPEPAAQSEPTVRAKPAAEPAADPPALLPTNIPGFTGRDAALRKLDALLGPTSDPPSTVVVSAIGGCGGIGKTALAVHWAHRVRDRFPDGQLYLNLRGFDPSRKAMTVTEALRALLELLRVPPARIPTSAEAQAGLYRSTLASSRTLVLLDNARDTDQVRPLLPGAPGSMVLVTSRDQLASLITTEGARPVRLDVLDDDEARRLLVNRLGVDRVAAEPDAVDEIIAACGGLPLALAIVAARAAIQPSFPLAGFADALTDARYRLDALSNRDPTADVRRVFSWSYEALRPPAARLFRLLGLHPGPDLGLSAAASLAGAPASQTRRLLAELTEAHLLTEHAPGRYVLHDLVRSYAAELAHMVEPDTGRQAAVRRLLDHYVHTSHRAAALSNPTRDSIELAEPSPEITVDKLTSTADANSWFDQERPVLLAAVDLAANSGYDAQCWRLAWTFADYLDRRGRWLDVLASQRSALDAASRHGDPSMQASSHLNLGMIHGRLGQHPQAEPYLEAAIRLNATLGRQRGLRRAHRAMAMNYDQQGRYREALRHDQLALEIAEAAGDRIGQIACLNGIGWQYAKLGDYYRSIAYCERALAVTAERAEVYRAATWDTLGYAYHQLGQLRQAVASYQRGAELFRQLGIRLGEAEVLAGLADSHDALGEEAAARTARLRALELFDSIRHPKADELRKLLE